MKIKEYNMEFLPSLVSMKLYIWKEIKESTWWNMFFCHSKHNLKILKKDIIWLIYIGLNYFGNFKPLSLQVYHFFAAFFGHDKLHF